MEIRRVQVTGGSSFVVTLPKEWAEKQNVKKNDPVGLITQPDGTLLLTKRLTEEPLQRSKEIPTSSIADPAYLFRLLIGTYINEFSEIRVTTDRKFPPFVMSVIRNFTQLTIGQEVVEETETLVVIKDLLNPSEMPFENTIKRMYVIVKSMHGDAIASLMTKNTALAESVVARDTDADRLSWLIARQTNMLMQNPALSRKMEIPITMAMNYYILCRIIERIGDHAVRIAENIRPLASAGIDPRFLSAIQKASIMSLEIFDRSIISFFNSDLKEAHRNIESIAALESVCGEIDTMVLGQETLVAIHVGYIAESIRRAGEYAGDISETAINMIVGDNDGQKIRGKRKEKV
jgi:phosphate uptake regulator